ncbi:unnamed protein product [Urochloa humidicola]
MASDPGSSPPLAERRQSASLNALARLVPHGPHGSAADAGHRGINDGCWFSESRCTRTCKGANMQIY